MHTGNPLALCLLSSAWPQVPHSPNGAQVGTSCTGWACPVQQQLLSVGSGSGYHPVAGTLN